MIQGMWLLNSSILKYYYLLVYQQSPSLRGSNISSCIYVCCLWNLAFLSTSRASSIALIDDTFVNI